MSQQKQQSWEPPNAPKSSPPQCPNPCLAPCSAPCGTPCSGGCHSSSQRSRAQNPTCSRRARRKPRCLRGGTTYHCKEEEC
ncbi:PREDICTED: late cornified envelope protein 6A [Galeopterus variegatus]|uniref:Late cornified envelope protein 6A n=1 Tax=Galeopterus variegatus TaxID=482537 RepID=A0ABM0RCZ0_GALVR|nr:PREDICTED: late cornified envelope protein 6A [Galeopterus variegatus]